MRITKAGRGLAAALAALGLTGAGCGPKEEAPAAADATPGAPGVAAPATAPRQAPPGGPPAPTPAGPALD